MNGTRKAAILLQSLDKSLAARVLAFLPRAQVEQATLAVATAENATTDELRSVLQEFKTRFQSPPVLQRDVTEIARELLDQRLDQVLSLERQQRLIPTAPADSRDSMPHSAIGRRDMSSPVESSPFDFLNGRHPGDVLQLLHDEQPQTIAVIAAQLPPAFSAAVLAGLTSDRQADVLQRVARLGPTDPEILADIAAVLKERLGRARVRAGGVSQVAAVLRESSRTATRSILATMEEDHDSNLAGELRQTLFSFDDLLKLDDDTLRVILQETDDRQWALALKASPATVRQKVLGCLSDRVARAFQDEMDSLGPVRLSEMTSVRQQIADSIHRLEEAGLIALPVR